MWKASVTGVLIAAVVAVACGGDSNGFHLPVRPTPTPASAPAPPPPVIVTQPTDVREIAVGEVVTGDINIAYQTCATNGPWPIPCRFYELTAPATGTPVATVTWDPVATDNLLLLKMEQTEIQPAPPAWSPVVGRLAVVSGHTYSLAVGLAGTGSGAGGPYTLTTKVE